MSLAAEGGTPVRTKPWPAWPPAATATQREALLDVLDSGAWGSNMGSRVESVVARFAEQHGASHGVAVCNGTIALFTALRGLGVQRGDEVIIPPFTFVATATAVLMAGAVPVFADIDPDTMLLDADAVGRAVTERTSAVIPVHLSGAAADVDAIRSRVPARARILEDAAQAHGAALRGRRVGSLGDAACFSFQSSKNVTAGEGGIILTNDETVYNACWSAANVGRERGGGWYEHPTIGWNLRMTEFQAALIEDQLASLDELNARRDKAAALLDERLAESAPGVRVLPTPESTTTHGRHLALLRFDPAAFGGSDKGTIAKLLGAEGIPVSGGYPMLHRDPAIQHEICTITDRPIVADCPNAEAAGEVTVWVPQTVLLGDDDDLADVAAAFAKVQTSLSAR